MNKFLSSKELMDLNDTLDFVKMISFICAFLFPFLFIIGSHIHMILISLVLTIFLFLEKLNFLSNIEKIDYELKASINILQDKNYELKNTLVFHDKVKSKTNILFNSWLAILIVSTINYFIF